jgi:hypothetical protein
MFAFICGFCGSFISASFVIAFNIKIFPSILLVLGSVVLCFVIGIIADSIIGNPFLKGD